MAELVPKAETGKEVGGWSEAGRRGVHGKQLEQETDLLNHKVHSHVIPLF